MNGRTLAHLSDLHIGKSAAVDSRVAALCQALLVQGVDQVVVTGDVTNRGRRSELERFERIFQSFAASGRLAVVPGNHDRLGDEIAGALMGPRRIDVARAPGLHLVRFDSTAPHNRSWLYGHGRLTQEDIESITAALDQAPPATLAVLLLHHHLLPFPHDSAAEWLSEFFGTAWAVELELGRTLCKRLAGRCDLVLHGHRHRPGTVSAYTHSRRPLALFNAGASADLGRVRIFQHQAGRLLRAPDWVQLIDEVAAGTRLLPEHVSMLGVQAAGLGFE